MKTYLIAITALFALLANSSSYAKHEDISAFLPEGYTVFETVDGDLNKDGLDDRILIIKGTDKHAIIQDDHRGELDRNRRGIIVLLNKGDGYTLAVKNNHCFTSENEDGGIYYAPELFIKVKKGNLNISYLHGRYGYWVYTFRLKDADFELIGYDVSDNSGPTINQEISINFLTKKKLVRDNLNKHIEDSDAAFKETWETIKVNKLLKLSEIEDFEALYFSILEKYLEPK